MYTSKFLCGCMSLGFKLCRLAAVMDIWMKFTATSRQWTTINMYNALLNMNVGAVSWFFCVLCIIFTLSDSEKHFINCEFHIVRRRVTSLECSDTGLVQSHKTVANFTYIAICVVSVYKFAKCLSFIVEYGISELYLQCYNFRIVIPEILFAF